MPFRRFQHDPYPQQLPLFRGRRTQPRLQNPAISRPQPHFHGIRYYATLNHGAKHRDSAIMTHSLQIVGTRAGPDGLFDARESRQPQSSAGKFIEAVRRALSLSFGLILSSAFCKGTVRRHEPSQHWRDQFCWIRDRLIALSPQDFSVSNEIAMNCRRQFECQLHRFVVDDGTEFELLPYSRRGSAAHGQRHWESLPQGLNRAEVPILRHLDLIRRPGATLP
jgi:hypothetical protein